MKPKHFNEAWAQIAAREAAEKFGTSLRVYKCPCGWWHVFDRYKARQKDDARESRSARRIRRRREIKEEARAARQAKQHRSYLNRKERAVALQSWENEGGACST